MSEQQPRRSQQIRVRREPRYVVFLGTGAAVGLVFAVVVGASGQVDPSGRGRGPLIGYLAIALTLLGGLLGGAVALLVERWGPGRR